MEEAKGKPDEAAPVMKGRCRRVGDGEEDKFKCEELLSQSIDMEKS